MKGLYGRHLSRLRAILDEAKSRPGSEHEDSVREAEDAFRWAAGWIKSEEIDTPEKAWREAVMLFGRIEAVHGLTEARRIFADLGAPSKKRHKKFTDLRLRVEHEHGAAAGLSLEKIAENLAKRSAELDGELYELPRAVTPSSIRMRISRLLKRK